MLTHAPQTASSIFIKPALSINLGFYGDLIIDLIRTLNLHYRSDGIKPSDRTHRSNPDKNKTAWVTPCPVLTKS